MLRDSNDLGHCQGAIPVRSIPRNMAQERPPVIDLEVVKDPNSDAAVRSVPVADSERTQDPSGRTPFHPAAAALLLVVDNLWNFADWAVLAWLVTIPLSFLSVFAPTFFIQTHLHGDSVPKALAKALFLGVIAAVPTSVTGTPVGLALLAWAGIQHARR